MNVVYCGYHGTSLENAKKIMKSMAFQESTNTNDVFESLGSSKKNYHWLGTGVYFWDNDFEMADFWGKQRYNKRNAVLKVPIVCGEDRILDLRKNKYRKSMEKMIEHMIVPELEKDFNSYSTNEKNSFIGFICDFLCESLKRFDVCYNDFIVDTKRSTLYEKITPQICVKNKSVIDYEKMCIVTTKGE